MVLFLAGLQGIPEVYYEAASIDGANWWQRFLHVTLPLLSPTTFFVIILEMIGSLQVFQQAYVMTQGGPALATTTLVFYLFQNGFRWFNMGRASAVAWVLFALIGFFSFIQFRLQERWVHYQ
jgi:multiple sugar transport system permease protein